MLVYGLILAGGRSSRFGSDKAFAKLAGSPLIAHVAGALDSCAGVLAIAGTREAAIFLDAIPLPDPPGCPKGPLSGVLAGLQWAQEAGADWLVTATCDVPLVPTDMGERLIEAAVAKGAEMAIARTSDGSHPLCGAWRPRLWSRLAKVLRHGTHPAVRRFAMEMSAIEIQFSERERFSNINTVADLKAAERYLENKRAHD
jgi:molybdopterin-guanine dinucleotide biosynthesis protein A